MKNKRIYGLSLFTFLLILLFSCGNPTGVIKKNTTASILKTYKKESQFFSFDNDSSFTIIAKEGTKIKITPNSFVYDDGTIPKGKINLELKEYYSPTDIVFNNLSTQADRCILETAGMIFIEAKSDNRILKLNNDKVIDIGFPIRDTTKNMNLYNGKFDGEYAKWDNVIDSVEQPGTYDTIYTEGAKIINHQKELDYYLFSSHEMGWLNCDKQLEGEDKTVLTLNIDTAIIPNARLVFSDIKSAAFPLFENGHLMFYNIPIGKKATLISFYKDGEKTFYCKKIIVVSSNMQENPEFKEVSLEGLKQEVDNIKW